MSEVWRDLILGALALTAFAFNLWTGKTHLFPWATYDREDEFSAFWLAQGILAVAAMVGFAFGIAAAV